MDNQLVTLGAAPRHLMGAAGLKLNQAARANLQASFAVLKIRGKNWRVRYRGDETLIAMSAGTDHNGRPLPETPVQYVDMVVVGIATAISKKWYQSGFASGEAKAPDCFSVNGVSPDPASALVQNTMCATCPQNIWGSATTENGRKAKACRDGRRIAMVPSGDVHNDTFGGPMLLDIPPTSLANLDRYTRHLERLGADISQVVTRIGFNPQVTHQELTFNSIGWIESAEDYSTVIEHGRSDIVQRMLEDATVEVTSEPAALGARPAHLQIVRQSPAAQVAPDQPEEPKPQPAPMPMPTPTPPPPPAPPAAATATPRKATGFTAPTTPSPTVVIQGAPASLEDEISSLLSDN
jgi:hypothetical protein